METRGRKSVSELAVVAVIPGERPEPSEDLTAEEAAYWNDVVATKPAEWWKADTQILLKAYCRASVQHDRVSVLVNSFSAKRIRTAKGFLAYDAARKLQATTSREVCTLATKMRLTPQARYDKKAAHVGDRKADDGDSPWQRKRSA